MTSLNATEYIEAYLQAQLDRTSFLTHNPVDWSGKTSAQAIVSWAFQFQDVDLIEHIAQTVSHNMVDFVLPKLFEHREKLGEMGQMCARQIVQRHTPQMDALLTECARHLDAPWMLLLAPHASDIAAAKAYGTVLHYATARVMGVDMWGKKLTNQFFDVGVQQMLADTLLSDSHGQARWAMVVDGIEPISDLAERITSLLQKQRLHHEVQSPSSIKISRKL